VKRLLVSMEDERYEDLRRFAFEKKVPMAELVRHAIEETFEDQLDGVAVQRGLEEYLRDPSTAMPLEVVMEQLGIELPDRDAPKSRTRAGAAAASRATPNDNGNRGVARRPAAKRRKEAARKR
jgi:cytochrome P450